MLSGRRRKRPEPTKPIFFIDRAVGRYVVAEAIRSRGFDALPMADVYPGHADQDVKDPVWILRADREGWIAITKDCSIIDHEDALLETTLRVFAFSNANLTGVEMQDRILNHLNRILQRAAKPGPYIDKITRKGLDRYWDPRQGITPRR